MDVQAGHTDNVIPHTPSISGSARALTDGVRQILRTRVDEVVEGTARLYGAKAKVTYANGYPVLVNHDRETDFAGKRGAGNRRQGQS